MALYQRLWADAIFSHELKKVSICIQATVQRPLTQLKQARNQPSVAVAAKFWWKQGRLKHTELDFKSYTKNSCLWKEALDNMEQPPSWNIYLGMALALNPICMWNPVFTNNSKDSREQFNNQRKIPEANQLFVVYTWFLFSKRSSCYEQIATNIFPL